jgi:hypothetical protein
MLDITEHARIYPITRAIDRTGAVVSASAWVNMENVEKAFFIVSLGANSTVDAQACTLYVANDGSGTKSTAIASSADLNFPYYYKNATGDVWTKTSVSASTFNMDSASASNCFIIEVKAEEMGVFSSGSTTYDATHVRLSLASPGAHAQLTSVMCLVTGLRYGQDTPPVVTT